MSRPSAGAGYEQLRLELKEHISQEFKKIESSLQSHNLKVEECRQDVASAHAEVIKVRDQELLQICIGKWLSMRLNWEAVFSSFTIP